MNRTISNRKEKPMSGRAPLGARIVLKDRVDWESLTDDEVIAGREKIKRLLRTPGIRLLAGRPDRGARIEERELDLPGRRLTLRVHRPRHASPGLPLVLVFHGGGFITGTAAQNDWLNSRLAAHCPAVVVGVEYRLAPEHPLPAPVEDGYDTLVRLREDPFGWGIDPDAVAVVGESAGGTIAALLALRAREEGPPLRAQVLIHPVVDWTGNMLDYPSFARNAGQPGIALGEFHLARRLSVPPRLDPRLVSPIRSASLAGLPPALIVTAALDLCEDHGRAYAERLREHGSPARFSSRPRATHKFMSVPGLVPAARPARREILAFLREHLRAAPGR